MASNQPTNNITLTQKRNLTQGHGRYMPLREIAGKDAGGNVVGTEVWHDFKENRSHYAGDGWSNGPPSLPSGDPGGEPRCKPPSQVYRDKYERIFGHA